MQWKIKSSKSIHKDKWISLRSDSCLMPNGTIIEPYYVLEYPNWINIVPLDENNDVILIRQYRHGIREIVLELPCGCVETHDSTPLDAAKRELLEETGYWSDTFIELCTLSPNPATHSNYTYCYLSLNSKKIQNQQLDDTEQIEIVTIPLNKLKTLIANNTIIQALHVASIFYALSYLDTTINDKS